MQKQAVQRVSTAQSTNGRSPARKLAKEDAPALSPAEQTMDVRATADLVSTQVVLPEIGELQTQITDLFRQVKGPWG